MHPIELDALLKLAKTRLRTGRRRLTADFADTADKKIQFFIRVIRAIRGSTSEAVKVRGC